MTSTLYVKDRVLEGTDNYNDAAVVIASDDDDDGVLLVTGDVSGSITLDVFEDGVEDAFYSTTMSAASVIDNTPIPWRLDAIGRNFRHRIRQVDLPSELKGGRLYRMEYQIPTTSDGILRLVFVWDVRPLEA